MTNLKKYKMFIGGEWVESDTKKSFKTLNPENNEAWAEVPQSSAKDVDRAVIVARNMFEKGSWSKTKPSHRKKILWV